MFRSARFKLTIVYCLVFFSIFWLFSAGLYMWMDKSLGEGYISKVQNQQVEQAGDVAFNGNSAQTVTVAGDVAQRQLKKVLIVLNMGMLAVVPVLAWLLTERTLRPIEKTYNKQKQFVSDASHELRTPLTIMQGELDVALKKPRSPQEYRAALKSTREEVGRLHELTEVLLFVAKSNQTQAGLNGTDKVDINDTLTEVTARLSLLAKKKSLELSFVPPTASLLVRGSRTSLNQLFTNLVNNAIKFTPKKGTVVVSTEPSDKDIIVTITDTGIGMSSDVASQAFERFYRADTARNQSGFGLGLSICKIIVEQHQGTIKLKSSPNEGTIVTVILPRVG